MLIFGVDLAGPTNMRETAMVCARADDSSLSVLAHAMDVDDAAIVEQVDAHTRQHDSDVVIGLDAPLSYNQRGGMRATDRELAALLRARGLPNSVMAPTLTRMAYLTLRGIALTRMLMLHANLHDPPLRIVEVHPGGAMALRNAPIEHLRLIKRSEESRSVILDWLRSQQFNDLPAAIADTDHLIAACGCVLAAWGWARGEPAWCAPAGPPLHPFDFAC
jgi:predicted nuclease with RNAse H fold